MTHPDFKEDRWRPDQRSLREDRWRQNSQRPREWFSQHPAWTIGSATEVGALHALTNLFESDLNISPTYVQTLARRSVEDTPTMPDESRAIYQDFCTEVDRQKRLIGYATRQYGPFLDRPYHAIYYHPSCLPRSLWRERMSLTYRGYVYDFDYEAWLPVCSHCGEPLMDGVPKDRGIPRPERLVSLDRVLECLAELWVYSESDARIICGVLGVPLIRRTDPYAIDSLEISYYLIRRLGLKISDLYSASLLDQMHRNHQVLCRHFGVPFSPQEGQKEQK